ncbi:Pycsar system effector family protein [Actinophytocola glycyrrhizae]|uniref:Pycsar system effector family protein n=1 Tax=Actinophytocola glycyrrhizae TaxID=2044873 RepID=A0ABV9SBA7_9PSEU
MLTTDFAWRVHGAQEAWTSKVDTKAAILLALEGGALFAILSANAKGGLLSQIVGWRQILEIIGASTLLAALVVAVGAVYPQLGSSRSHERAHRGNFIYFGHLRHWEPGRFRAELCAFESDMQLDMLCLQLIEMSKRNWRKHRLVQVSLSLALLSVGFFAIAILF